jgi:hypothetical protein
MALVGFEPAIPENDRPQTHSLDRAAPGISKYLLSELQVEILQKTSSLITLHFSFP